MLTVRLTAALAAMERFADAWRVAQDAVRGASAAGASSVATRMSTAPASLTLSMAADSELAVASIGSTTMITRSSRSAGALK